MCLIEVRQGGLYLFANISHGCFKGIKLSNPALTLLNCCSCIGDHAREHKDRRAVVCVSVPRIHAVKDFCLCGFYFSRDFRIGTEQNAFIELKAGGYGHCSSMPVTVD